MNCPAWYLAADQGTGMTYASSLDERRSLVDFTLRPYIAAIEARLSMDDITPRGQIVRFDLDDFLRGNPIERIAVWEKMIQLGLMTVDEVRAEEDLAPRGNEAI
jgi:phage portal protein BeeE